MVLSFPCAAVRFSSSAFWVLSGEAKGSVVLFYPRFSVAFSVGSHAHFPSRYKLNVCIGSHIHTLQPSFPVYWDEELGLGEQLGHKGKPS